MRIVSGIAAASLAVAAGAPATAQAQAAEAAVTRAYWSDAIDSAGLPPATIERRQQALRPLCPLPAEAGLESAVLAGLATGLFGILRGVAERAADRRAAARLDAMTRTQGASLTGPSHPLATAQQRCIIFERSSAASDDAVYALRLNRVGTTAFVAELVLAQLNASSVWATRGLAQQANVTIGVAVRSLAPGKSPPELDDPVAWQGSFGPIGPGPARLGGLPSSGVMPLRDGGPTTVAITVTEAHPAIEAQKERDQIARESRKLLLDALGGVVSGAVENGDD